MNTKKTDNTCSVKLSKDFYSLAKKTAKYEGRTISGQIVYWAKKGKATLEKVLS